LIIAVSLLWARFRRSVWNVLWITRGVGLVLLIGIALFFLTAQGQELFVVAGDQPTTWVWCSVAVAYCAAQSWHWARAALSTKFGVERDKWWVLWLPRIYALLVHVMAVIALLHAMLHHTGPDRYLLYTLAAILSSFVVFATLMTRREDLRDWLV